MLLNVEYLLSPFTGVDDATRHGYREVLVLCGGKDFLDRNSNAPGDIPEAREIFVHDEQRVQGGEMSIRIVMFQWVVSGEEKYLSARVRELYNK